MTTKTIQVGDFVQVTTKEGAVKPGVARVERKLRRWRGVPGIIMLDRKIEPYWTYPRDQLVKIKPSKALYRLLQQGGQDVPEAV